MNDIQESIQELNSKDEVKRNMAVIKLLDAGEEAVDDQLLTFYGALKITIMSGWQKPLSLFSATGIILSKPGPLLHSVASPTGL